MNRKSGACRGGEKGVMNYSSKVEDGRNGCQLTNQAEREGKKEGGNRAEVERKMEREKALERIKKKQNSAPSKVLYRTNSRN